MLLCLLEFIWAENDMGMWRSTMIFKVCMCVNICIATNAIVWHQETISRLTVMSLMYLIMSFTVLDSYE
jgi:hypothetical protein